MPDMTYPNQRIVKIHRERPAKDFLGIKNENWKAAARDLSAHALKLYFYLAANADNYTLALSPSAVLQEINMARSTYHDQVQALISKGYLVHSHGNTYEFYEIPRPRGGISTSEDPAGVGQISENNPADDKEMPDAGSSVLPQDTEIDNKGNPTDRGINNEIYVPKVVEVCIPVPVAQGPKRPQLKQTQKKEEFVF